MLAAHGPVIAVGLLIFGAAMIGLIMITWIGVRNGDEFGDLKVTVDHDQLCAAAPEIGVRVENPSVRPVVITVRARPVPRAAVWLGTPVSHKTFLRPVIMPPDDAVLEVIPADTARCVAVPVDPSNRGPYLQIDTIIYERPGRVRRVSHQVGYAAGGVDLDHAASRRSASS